MRSRGCEAARERIHGRIGALHAQEAESGIALTTVHTDEETASRIIDLAKAA